MADNAESDERCEYVAPVKWVASVERDQAKWEAMAGIYTTTHVRASLDGQPKTIAFLEKEFRGWRTSRLPAILIRESLRGEIQLETVVPKLVHLRISFDEQITHSLLFLLAHEDVRQPRIIVILG